jgi:hypothetical protein
VAIITDDGKPVLAITSSELYGSMLKTLEILSDPEQVALLQSGLRDIAARRTESWETVKTNLPPCWPVSPLPVRCIYICKPVGTSSTWSVMSRL